MWHKFVIIVALLYIIRINTANAACTINVNGDLGDPQPLLIRPGSTQFFNPQGTDGIIHLNDNQQLELYCSSGFASPAGIATNSITVTCTSGNRFSYNSIAYYFNNYYCSAYPAHKARKTGGRCYNNGYEVEIGFEVGTRFLRIMTVCHNEIVEENYYAKYKLTPANVGYQIGFPRPNFITGDFFGGKNVDYIYSRNQQRNVIAQILNSQARAEYYIHPTNDFFLARGHMAAKTDFIFGSQHRATFYFLNTAPQWQKFNALNWEAIEDSSKKLAAARGLDLDVYTGVYGRCKLADESGRLHDIYLYPNGTYGAQIPVPALYYKILVDAAGDAGIVLIGVNNPYLTYEEIQRDYVICHDISSQITWSLNWQRENIERGYSYACSVSDFLRVVPHVSLYVTRLLV
ncbi:hypothetical protein PVAND_010366 [Polypedilum vanderplanki]|uniref:DNA/RNA non-specific endonuclease/pyrophosphatase/phosphodiesterase domain-containing protein n=1 Tax=Polypedilum vanderplanki TaxID=319348 RepID=A0A9J6CG69_POLVA|nr:hypothetical protein PVAND_010366 [Polypedilum vanderplanki]